MLGSGIVKGIFNLAATCKLIFLVLPAVLQNMIGLACNSQIPQANLHAALNFVRYMQRVASNVSLIFENFACGGPIPFGYFLKGLK
jgi:hypothetical protein